MSDPLNLRRYIFTPKGENHCERNAVGGWVCFEDVQESLAAHDALVSRRARKEALEDACEVVADHIGGKCNCRLCGLKLGHFDDCGLAVCREIRALLTEEK